MGLLLKYWDVAPDTISALSGLNAYSDQCSISQNLRRLVEILVSKINGCSYCIMVHEKQAVELGESAERLKALENWSAGDLFTIEEKAAFEWAEYVTRLDSGDVREKAFKSLEKHYSEKEIVDLTFVALSMNAWNRIAISFRHEA